MSVSTATPARSPAVREGRGHTEIAERVVSKIIAQAATEISGAGGRSGGWLGIGSHVDLDARPEVKVELSGRSAKVSIKLGVAYPAPIAAAVDRVRYHVRRRTAELAGVEVARIDVDVVALHRTGGLAGHSASSTTRERSLT